MTGHVQRERAPSASRFHDGVARAQAHLAADVLELGGLRLRQRRLRGGEVRARVHELVVQPEAIELVAEVVVIVDVLAGPAQVVRIPPRLLDVLSDRRLPPVPVDRLQESQEVAAHDQPSARIGVTEGHGRVTHQCEKGAAVLDHDFRHLRRVGQVHGGAVPQGQAEGNAEETLPDPREHPAVEATGRARRRPLADRVFREGVHRSCARRVVHRPDPSPYGMTGPPCQWSFRSWSRG